MAASYILFASTWTLLSILFGHSIAIDDCSQQLPLIENGIIGAGSSLVGSQRPVTCNYGFYYNHVQDYAICNVDGQWILKGACVPRLMPVSHVNQCSDSPFIENGVIGPGLSTVGSSRKIVCHPGFYFNNVNDSMICSPYGHWASKGACVARIVVTMPPPQSANHVRCSGNPTIDNGQVADGLQISGSRRKITCNTGYYYNHADEYVTCTNEGQWVRYGTCIIRVDFAPPTHCGPTPLIHFAVVSSGPSNIRSRRRITCQPGYFYNNAYQYLTCSTFGHWTHSGSCVRRVDPGPTLRIIDWTVGPTTTANLPLNNASNSTEKYIDSHYPLPKWAIAVMVIFAIVIIVMIFMFLRPCLMEGCCNV